MMHSSNESELISIKEKLVDMMCNDTDLPTLGSSVSSVMQLTAPDEQSIEQLSNYILSDSSLTLKILRLSNSIAYRATAMPVTSISTAIQLLGMDTIKSCALAMTLVESMPSKHARAVRTELLLALSASLIARNLVKHSVVHNPEEVVIAALFKNIGRLVVAAYDKQLYWKTIKLSRKVGYTEARASLQQLGCTFNWLTEFALQKWHIPNSIVHAIKLLPEKLLKPPKNRNEWMQQVAEFSNHAALITLCNGTAAATLLADDLLERYGGTLDLDRDQLNILIDESIGQVQTICNDALNLQIDQEMVESLCGYSTDQTDVEEDLADSPIFGATQVKRQQIDRYLSGKPFDAVDRLLAGVQEVSEILMSDRDNVHAVLMHVLETYYSSLCFQFVTLCLQDGQTDQLRAKNSFGLDHDKIQKDFVLSDIHSNDLFSIALKRNVDLSIQDATDPRIRDALPDWHKQLLPDTKSFMVLPLVMQHDIPLGLIYADRSVIAQEGITTDEMKLIKALKAQLLVVLSRL